MNEFEYPVAMDSLYDIKSIVDALAPSLQQRARQIQDHMWNEHDEERLVQF
jgi:hypothetical protein